MSERSPIVAKSGELVLNTTHGLPACGKTFASATGALRGRGFQPRLTSFSKTYGTAGSRAPSKLRRRAFFRKLLRRGLYSYAASRLLSEIQFHVFERVWAVTQPG